MLALLAPGVGMGGGTAVVTVLPLVSVSRDYAYTQAVSADFAYTQAVSRDFAYTQAVATDDAGG